MAYPKFSKSRSKKPIQLQLVSITKQQQTIKGMTICSTIYLIANPSRFYYFTLGRIREMELHYLQILWPWKATAYNHLFYNQINTRNPLKKDVWSITTLSITLDVANKLFQEEHGFDIHKLSNLESSDSIRSSNLKHHLVSLLRAGSKHNAFGPFLHKVSSPQVVWQPLTQSKTRLHNI